VSTNGHKRDVYARRRSDFMRQLGKGVVLLPTAPVQTRSNDTDFPFRPDSDFYYLTGFGEPNAVAVLRPKHPTSFLLFVQPRDREQEIWNGRRAGPEGAKRRFGADEAYTIERFDADLPNLLAGAERIYVAPGKYPDFDAKVNAALNRMRGRSRTGVRPPAVVADLRAVLHEMRLVKHPEDLMLQRRAAEVSAAAHLAAMRACRPGMMEYEIEAVLDYVFKKNGARFAGYNHIVASGANATILHYTENDRKMQDGELLLIDAGAEVNLFSGDITRTFPVNGRFSPAQRQLYSAVLAAQKAVIRMVRPGVAYNRLQETAVRVLTRGLRDLGFLKGALPELIQKEKYKSFYMHGVSHWLGMDVHDVGSYRQGKTWRRLEPGMVLTVEPGLYVAPGTRGVPKAFQGMGIRIEDDVLVTKTGNEVLTAAVPKEIADIEAVMAGGRRAVASQAGGRRAAV
jgi:Xaa-Pro aminopeptidase